MLNLWALGREAQGKEALWEVNVVLRQQMKVGFLGQQQWGQMQVGTFKGKGAVTMPGGGGGAHRHEACARGPGTRGWWCLSQRTNTRDTESEASVGCS